MPTVDGFEVPKAIQAQWRRELEDADDGLLLKFAKRHPYLVKGARLTRSGVPLIRKRLMSRATAKGEQDEAVRDLIATCGLDLEFIAVFSEEALELGFAPLATIYGYERFVAAMLVDHREDVREQVIEILKQEEPPPEMDRAEAFRSAKQIFGRFLEALGEWTDRCDDDAAKEGRDLDNPGAEIEALKALLAEARQKRAGEKALQKKIDKLQAKFDALESVRHGLSEERDERDTAIHRLQAELKEAGKRNADLQAEMESRVAARVRDELDSVKRSWFRAARELDAAWRESRDAVDDVLAASEAALARQAEVDRHSGNLRDIRKRLGQLHAARDALRQAGTDALSPLPEVAAAAERVDREIDRLEAILPETTASATALAAELQTRIARAESEEDLGRLVGLIDQLVEQALLSREDARTVHVQLNLAIGKRYDRFMPKVVAGPEDTSTDPVCLLRGAIAGNAPVILLVDGHNVLFSLADRFEGCFDKKGVPGAAARDALLELLRPFAASPSRCEVRLYFDGPRRSETGHGANLIELYSGGGDSDQRADRIMVEYLEYCAQAAAPLQSESS